MNTCYYYQDLLPGPVHTPARGRFNPASGIRPTRLRPGIAIVADRASPVFRTRPGIATPMWPRPFSGLPHSAGELLRTP